MAILLTVLKWIGIILLAVLVLTLVLIFLILLVPFRYKGRAGISDPECHEKFPTEVLKERTDMTFDVTWLLGIVRIAAAYPGAKLVSVKVFGKDVWPRKSGKKSEEESPEETEEEEEEEEGPKSLSERVDALIAKSEKYITFIDNVYRILTGSCGRRAWNKVSRRLLNIGRHSSPRIWRLTGNVGLNDPCLNGRLTAVNSILMPFADDHLQVETEWDLYRCNLEAAAAGKIRIIVPVKEMLPLVFDKDCRKVYMKLKKAKAKL